MAEQGLKSGAQIANSSLFYPTKAALGEETPETDSSGPMETKNLYPEVKGIKNPLDKQTSELRAVWFQNPLSPIHPLHFGV